MKTILAPVDFSAITPRVIDSAVALAQALSGRVVVLHVIPPPIVATDYGASINNLQEILAISEKTASRELERIRANLSPNGPSVETVQEVGTPVAVILETAEKLPADYIIMGSHGHTSLYELLVGSTASGVLKKSPCPVVILPPERDKKKPIPPPAPVET